MLQADHLRLGDEFFDSRLLMGTARFPSPHALRDALASSEAQVITVSLRREAQRSSNGHRFWDYLKDGGHHILPNTAGCRTATEAVTTAMMARDIFGTNWIKLEVIGNEQTMQPDPFGLIEATEALVGEGFEVFPYTTEDLVVADRLVRLGCRILMPWAAPIGSGQGISNPSALTTFRKNFPDVTLIVDAGIGRPSHAAKAMEMGFDAVLLNTAVAQAQDPSLMAMAFAHSIRAGRWAYRAGLMRERSHAVASTPEFGRPFSPLEISR